MGVNRRLRGAAYCFAAEKITLKRNRCPSAGMRRGFAVAVVIGNSAAVGRRVYVGEPALAGSMPFCGRKNHPETKKVPLRRNAEGFLRVWGGFAAFWGRAAGPAAQPPTRAKPAGFGKAETACGRRVRFAAGGGITPVPFGRRVFPPPCGTAPTWHGPAPP